jgi:SAM-dependent methyltransferase
MSAPSPRNPEILRRLPKAAYVPEEYWADVATDPRLSDAQGFSPVLHPAAPVWFNRLMDRLQFRAMRRAIALAALPPGARILDVGCGTGRWVRRYGEMGLQVTGVDATLGMLNRARGIGTGAPLVAGSIRQLPFADASFDCVTDVTVLQHIPSSLQPTALYEMLRVLQPQGRLILFELIRGNDAHIFPRSSQEWISQASLCGAALLGCFGQEFLLLDRFFVNVAKAVLRSHSHRAVGSMPVILSASQQSSTGRHLYWEMRRVTATLSAWTDPLAEKILPAKRATHGVFIFQKACPPCPPT